MILLTGLLAGVLDGSAAIIHFLVKGGKDPSKIFKFIASGIFGGKAFAGGNEMIVYGVLFHFMIALSFTAFYFLIYPKIKMLSANVFLSAILYGLFVWAVMNLVVLPLSNTPPLGFKIGNAAVAAGILILCIGVPVSLLAHKYYSQKSIQPR